MLSLGSNIKKLRILNNLTQLELADKLNLSKANISKYESNQIEPNTETLIALSSLFNVSVDYLLENKNSDSPAEAEEPEDENTVNINILCKGAGPETIKVSRDDLEIVKDIIKKFQEKRNKEL